MAEKAVITIADIRRTLHYLVGWRTKLPSDFGSPFWFATQFESVISAKSNRLTSIYDLHFYHQLSKILAGKKTRENFRKH